MNSDPGFHSPSPSLAICSGTTLVSLVLTVALIAVCSGIFGAIQ